MASRPLRSDPAALVALLSGPGRSDLTRFLIRQRWFAAKTRGIAAVDVLDWAVLDPDGPRRAPARRGGRRPVLRPGHRVGRRRAGGHRSPAPARRRWWTRTTTRASAGASSPPSPPAARSTVAAAASPSGPPRAGRSPPIRTSLATRRLTGEQSNTSVVIGDLVLKSLRRPQPGLNPDLEITRFLTTRTAFRHVPATRGLGGVRRRGRARDARGAPGVRAERRRRMDPRRLDARGPRRGHRAPAGSAAGRDVRRLGAITGGLHAALASDDRDADFRPEPVDRDDVARWAGEIARELAAPDVRGRLARRRRADGRRRAADARRHGQARGHLGEDPHPRRLPPRPGAQDAGRLRDHRLRGRAGAAARRAPPEAAGPARRGGHAALPRLRRARGRPSSAGSRAGRGPRGPHRLGGAGPRSLPRPATSAR